MINVNLGPSATPCPDSIEVEGAPLGIACMRLAVSEERAFELVVDRFSQDDITQAILNQRYDYPPGFTLLRELAPDPGRVVDLGAHIGTFACYAAALGHTVLAVEASRHNVALIGATLARDQSLAVNVIHAALSDQAGTIEFVQAGPYGVVANPSVIAPTIQVGAATVDALLAEMGWTGVDFLKLDIEGSEVKAVRGMAGLLSRPDAPTVFYESNYYTLAMFGETPQSLMRALEGFGYQCYLIDGSWLRPARSGEFQPATNVDYLAIKRPLPALKSWQPGPPLAMNEIAERVAATSSDPHPLVRLCMARALADAGPAILAQARVQQALLALQQDPDVRVREAAAWWQSRSVNPLRRWWWALRGK